MTALPPRLQEALELVLTEATETIAADRIICGYTVHHEDLAGVTAEAQRVWAFLEQAVCWKLALAVNRLLQPGSKDRASLLGLIREVRSAAEKGFQLHDPALFEQAVAAVERMHALPEVNDLRQCRDGFMAHTLIGGRRTGMKLETLRELSDAAEQLIMDLHLAITGQESPLHDRYCDWLEWSDPWWERIFPDA